VDQDLTGVPTVWSTLGQDNMEAAGKGSEIWTHKILWWQQHSFNHFQTTEKKHLNYFQRPTTKLQSQTPTSTNFFYIFTVHEKMWEVETEIIKKWRRKDSL
jgi:hypothetical protein